MSNAVRRGITVSFWVLSLGLTSQLPSARAQYPSEVVGFNGGTIDDPSAQEMFRIPEWSGSTVSFVIPNDTGQYNYNYAARFSGLQTEGAAAMQVMWYWVDMNAPDAWVRLTTFAGPERPNPSLNIEGKVRFKFTNKSQLFTGAVGICLSIRESGINVPQLADGGTAGDIEWVGVDTSTLTLIKSGPDGIIQSTLGGDDVIVDTNADPNIVNEVISWGANRVFESTWNSGSDDVRVYGVYASDAGAIAPIPQIIIDPAPGAYGLEWNLVTGAVSIDGVPQGGGIAPFTGNGDLSAPNDRGTLEAVCFTNYVANAADQIIVAIDELQFESPIPDPVLPPTVVAPIATDDTEVTVTDLIMTVDRVALYVNGGELQVLTVSDPNDVTFTIAPAVTGDNYQARQRDGVTADWSDPSAPVTVAFTPPVIYKAPAAGDTTVTIQQINALADNVTIVVNDATEFSSARTPGPSTYDVPVSGLVVGDSVTAYYSVGAVDSVQSAADTVTESTITVRFSDNMEAYVDQADFENASGEVRNFGWWPSSGDPGLTLVTDRNATVGGTKSAYAPAGQSPPYGGWTDGWQSNFDFAYPEPDFPDMYATDTSPLVWSVNIYDAGGTGTDNLYQWAELRDYTTGSLGAIIAVGMPGTSFFPTIDNNYYAARIYVNPGYVNLNDPGAPTRTVGWHTFTTVIKASTIDFYVDGILARKNVSRPSRPFDNLYMSSGYAPGREGWYDDYYLYNGKVTFQPRLPNAPCDVEFHQLNWYQPDGLPAQMNSVWGRVTFSYVPGDYTLYANVTLSNGPNAPEVWAVQNVPFFGVDNGDYSPRREAVDIDLTSLGLAPGDAWLTVFYAVDVSLYPAAGGPSPAVTPGTVAPLDRFASDSTDEAPVPGPFVNPGAPTGAQAGAAAAAAGNDERATNEVQEGRARCCAGAFARILDWLNRKHNLGINRTAQQIYDDLVTAGVSRPNADHSPARDEWINAKNQYARGQTGNKIVTKVWDRGTDVDAVAGVPESGGDFDEWLKREMEQSEGVELAYFYPGDAHIVTVTRVFTQNGKTYVKYRDDENQGDNAGADRGDTSVEQAEIYKKDGQYHFGSDANTIYFAVSESRVREPTVGANGGVNWTTPAPASSGTTSKDTRPIHDFVPPNGGSLEFYWTMGRYEPGQVPQQHPGYKKYQETNNGPDALQRRFYRPDDPTVTDWYQVVTYADGRSAVYGGNIRQSSPWAFYPLDELPDVDYRIPDFAPTSGDPGLTICAAVNLELYLQSNPNGPLDGAWNVGDTLDSLGLQVVNGQMPGMAGMYFALTEFTIDPNSATGWVPVGSPGAWLDSALFQAEYGDIAIAAAHDGVDETPPSLPWYEPFDSYRVGQGLHGTGGWSGWDDDPAGDAVVSAVHSSSPPHAVDVVAATNIVREFSGASAGVWACSAIQYIPDEFSGPGSDPFAGSYFILLNSYVAGGPHVTSDHSVQMQFDHGDGMLKVYHGDGSNTINVLYATERWVPIQVVVDLDNDWTSVYYDGNLLTGYPWTGGVYGDGGGALNIAALGLFANGTTCVYYDDLRLQLTGVPSCPGDTNCDGQIDFADINAFVDAVVSGTYCDGTGANADLSGNGSVGFEDINPFVDLLTQNPLPIACP